MLFYNTLAVAGDGLSPKCRDTLSQMGFSVRILSPYHRLSVAVSSHADMLMLPIDNKIFTFSEYAKENNGVFDEISQQGREICYVSASPEKEYPRDVLLNCLMLGKTLMSNNRYTASEILDHARNAGYNCVNVNQGYARCTACPVSENAVITADPSIAKAATVCKCDVLSVSVGGVILDGYDYGFIGGACGVFKDMIFFAGDIMGHPDGATIVSFCRDHGMTPISLSDEPICDVGSIFFF